MSSERPRPRRWARALVTSASTRLWLVGFDLLGRLAPPGARPWRSPGGQCVWVLAPHPDDETAGCAGTLARHRAAGDEVTIIVATDGRGSRALGLGPQGMARRRRAEMDEAARRLGASALVWLGLPEGAWEEAALVTRLRALWEARRAPDLLYAPSAVDFHPEHRRVAQALAATLAGPPEGAAPAVRVYPVQVPLTTVLTTLVCDVSAQAATIAAAIDAHVTQRDSLSATWRLRRYAAARHRQGGLAETFWELKAADYACLHRGPAADGASFRGLRRLPLTDPLAYWRGRRWRRVWAAGRCA